MQENLTSQRHREKEAKKKWYREKRTYVHVVYSERQLRRKAIPEYGSTIEKEINIDQFLSLGLLLWPTMQSWNYFRFRHCFWLFWDDFGRLFDPNGALCDASGLFHCADVSGQCSNPIWKAETILTLMLTVVFRWLSTTSLRLRKAVVFQSPGGRWMSGCCVVYPTLPWLVCVAVHRLRSSSRLFYRNSQHGVYFELCEWEIHRLGSTRLREFAFGDSSSYPITGRLLINFSIFMISNIIWVGTGSAFMGYQKAL